MLVPLARTCADRARYLATQARQPVAHYEHREIGFNYRLSNLLAALGRGQLRGLDRRIARQRTRSTSATARLSSDLPGVEFMPIADYGEPNYWLTCITIDPDAFGADREAVRLALEAEDIESRPTWKPLHLQPVFADLDVVGGPVAAGMFAQGLCLPSGSNLGYKDQERVVTTIRALCRTA